MKSKTKAFKATYSFTTPGGRRVRKRDYFEISDPDAWADFAKCKAGSVTEVPLRAPGLARLAKPEPAQGDAAPEGDAGQPEGESAPQGASDEASAPPEPDWSYKTIPAMRAWLDSCGVELPAKSTRKPALEEICKAAWASGYQPHPLYGLPGGPEVAPGLGFSTEITEDLLRERIEQAETRGIEVSEETWKAYSEFGQERAGLIPGVQPGDEVELPELPEVEAESVDAPEADAEDQEVAEEAADEDAEVEGETPDADADEDE